MELKELGKTVEEQNKKKYRKYFFKTKFSRPVDGWVCEDNTVMGVDTGNAWISWYFEIGIFYVALLWYFGNAKMLCHSVMHMDSWNAWTKHWLTILWNCDILMLCCGICSNVILSARCGYCERWDNVIGRKRCGYFQLITQKKNVDCLYQTTAIW